MQTFLLRFSAVLITLSLALGFPAHASGKTPNKQHHAAYNSKTSQSKKAAPKQKVAKKKATRGEVKKRAIARARNEVRVRRVVAPATTLDNPGLLSAGALVMNAHTGEIMYEKNADTPIPIASITKLMTAMVVLDARQPLNELISIDENDIDTLKNTTSRLQIGTVLTRGEMLLLALMSSENRAASALGRHFPGGRDEFIRRMNEKARQLGMSRTTFVDSSGLNPHNISTPRDLGLMVKAAARYTEIQQFSTSSEYMFHSNRSGRELTFRNTNPLVKSENWEISLSKTGYISEAGRCLVMEVMIDDAPVVMILMDSNGKLSRVGDANRVRKWLEFYAITRNNREG